MKNDKYLSCKEFVPKALDLGKVKTYSAWERHNLVDVNNMARPEEDPVPDWDHPEFDELVERIVNARLNDRPVVVFMGAHVIKLGLSRYIIRLMEEGVITHIASNGAGSIHDFELAYLGGTSEHVPTAIEDGSFGMWEETGAWMNEAIRQGYAMGYGYGKSLACYIENNPDKFPHKEDCIVYRAYKMGVPATYHVTIGTDIIHQHPLVDFAALGGSSGIDFTIFCNSISHLEGGVFLNIGSAVTGAEVFLKALSIGRNQGYTIERITTANFDIIPLGDYRGYVGDDHFHYYYRPRKNVINRPTSLGGKGFYIQGNHKDTIPNLYDRVMGRLAAQKLSDEKTHDQKSLDENSLHEISSDQPCCDKKSKKTLFNMEYSPIEIINMPNNKPPIKSVIFDFDGTLSTLRQGWEDIMEPLMLEMITGGKEPSFQLREKVKQYIDESTGIQTIFQMEWLEEQVRLWGINPVVQDKWWYKDEYNRRLLDMVRTRVEKLERGEANPEDFLIKGSKEFLDDLSSMDLDLYVASGTDHGDVVREVEALGLSHYFTQIAGAPERRMDCSKEEILRILMEDKGLKGSQLLVIGDGKVEIALGVEAGAMAIGVATDEIKRQGVNPSKRKRLKKAGAHIIIGDFLCRNQIIEMLFS
ncbi:MAG: HAD family hydrolase [Caldicoprobacterales bacterium]|jgi:phosphoglycolate phosphatase-like HAD superfamily hydrolase